LRFSGSELAAFRQLERAFFWYWICFLRSASDCSCAYLYASLRMAMAYEYRWPGTKGSVIDLFPLWFVMEGDCFNAERYQPTAVSRVWRHWSSGERRTRRRSWAFNATTMVDALIMMAPTAGLRVKPVQARTPAASGMAITL
jgi:hypothetical protein